MCLFQMARAVWLYYMCKVTELLDTVFFVLRKKQNQISFLHVYHHTLMPICGFIGLKYFAGKIRLLSSWIIAFDLLYWMETNEIFFKFCAMKIVGGHGTLLGLINSFIHVIMYSYYLLAAMGPHMQKYLWWKKYLTIMQIVSWIFIYRCLHEAK